MDRQPCSIVYAKDGPHIFDCRDEAYGLYLIAGNNTLITASNSYTEILDYMEKHPNPCYAIVDWRANRWIYSNGKFL